MSANQLIHQAMWFCSSPFCIAHHSAKSSRVLISGRWFFIIGLIGAFVRGISSSRHCAAAFPLSSQYWISYFQAFVREIWKPASWWFDCRYSCLRSIIAFSRSSELTFKWLPSRQIWSEKWFRRCIFTKLKSDSSKGCCAISDSICISSSSTRRRFAAAERLFQAGSFSHSSCFSKVCCIFKASETFFVDLLVRNRLKTSFWWWNSSRKFSMYSIVASVWYWYCAIRWKYTKFLMHNRASLKGILWLAQGLKRVAVKTGTIIHPSAFISLPLHWVTWLYGLLNRAEPGYGGIIAQSWWDLSILVCCSRKDLTETFKSLSIPIEMVWRISGTIIVVREMGFIFQKTPSEVPTARSSSCFPCLCRIPLSRKYHGLEVYPIFSQLPWRWIPFSQRRYRCVTPRAMGLLDWMQLNVFEVFSRPCADDRITLQHPTVRTKHKLSSVEKRLDRTKNKLEDLP